MILTESRAGAAAWVQYPPIELVERKVPTGTVLRARAGRRRDPDGIASVGSGEGRDDPGAADGTRARAPQRPGRNRAHASATTSSRASRDVIESGTLTSTKGTQVPELEQRFAALLGVAARGRVLVRAPPRSTPRSPRSTRSRATRSSPRRSPTWARSPPILYQGAIPVFADVDSAHRQRHRGDRRGPRSRDRTEGDHGHAPVRQPVRDRRDPGRSPTRAASR